MSSTTHKRHPIRTPYAGVAATPTRGRGGIFRKLFERRKAPESKAVDHTTLEPEIRRAADHYEVLKVVTKGRLGGKLILVLDTRNEGVHLEITRDGVNAKSNLGRILAAQAGVTEFVPEIIKTMCSFSKPFEKLHKQGIIQYDSHNGRFLVHIVYKPRAERVRLQLAEPYKSFFILRVAKANMHSANEAIGGAIRGAYPRVEVTGIHQVPVTKERPVLSIATVTRDDGLHVSIHERPSYIADTNAQRNEDRVGATVFFIERSLKRRLISTLRAMNVKKLYLLTTTGLTIRTEIDLEKAEHDLQFKAPEEEDLGS